MDNHEISWSSSWKLSIFCCEVEKSATLLLPNHNCRWASEINLIHLYMAVFINHLPMNARRIMNWEKFLVNLQTEIDSKLQSHGYVRLTLANHRKRIIRIGQASNTYIRRSRGRSQNHPQEECHWPLRHGAKWNECLEGRWPSQRYPLLWLVWIKVWKSKFYQMTDSQTHLNSLSNIRDKFYLVFEL